MDRDMQITLLKRELMQAKGTVARIENRLRLLRNPLTIRADERRKEILKTRPKD